MTTECAMDTITSLFAKNILEVLSVLALNPDDEVHQSNIAKRTGLRLVQAQRALERLQSTGLVMATQRGKMKFYKAQTSHPLFADLKNILIKTLIANEIFKKELSKLVDQIKVAFIYGSFATGAATAVSDIDLFIIGDVSLKQLSGLLTPIAQQLQREINPIVYSLQNYNAKLREKNHFILEVTSTDKIWIIGNDNDFKQMVG